VQVVLLILQVLIPYSQQLRQLAVVEEQVITLQTMAHQVAQVVVVVVQVEE
jgi:hypothetical protein